MSQLDRPDFLRNLTLTGMILIAVLFSVFPADATNWQANIKPGSDIVMHDLRWPEWDAGTYYCFWYMSFYPKYSSLYGGVAVHGPDKTPGMFTSYWCPTETVYEGPEFYGKGFGAEGSKGGANGSPSFQRPNSWYRMVKRTFPPTRGAKDKTNVGWWIKDVEHNKWYTHSVLSIPQAVTGFQANSGFVEALAPETTPRAFERRLGYCRLNGKWHDSPLSANDATKFKLIENNSVVRFDRSGPDSRDTWKKEPTFFRTEQPDSPILDRPGIDQAEANASGNQINVRWKIPHSASPQLGYKIEAFTDSEARGELIAFWEDAAPHVNNKRLDTTSPAKSVRLTIKDIFDQQIELVFPVKNILIPAATSSPTKIQTGLKYTYYENLSGKTWTTLPDCSTVQPVKRGYVKDLDDTIKEDRLTDYAVNFEGYLRVPKDGLYVISAGTSDGSRLSIDEKLIADNDGIHSTSPKRYSVALREGLRPFKLEYFKGANDGNSKQSTTAKIDLRWEGPNFELRKLTRKDFACGLNAKIPIASLALNEQVSNSVLQDNLARLQVKIQNLVQPIKKLQLFAGKVLLTTRFPTDMNEEGKFDIKALIPEGRNQIWARVWFGDGHSIDSTNELVLNAKNQTVAPWQFTSMLKGGFPLAVRSDASSASFMGEGFGFVHQTIEGDFTLSARIANMPLTSTENGLWKSNWLGLSIFSKHSHPKVRITDKGPYNPEISLFLTAEGKMKGAKDFPDLAGTNKSIASFEGDHRWLRLVRRGARFQSYTSADGSTWQLADERFTSHSPKEVYAGICFRSGPNKSRSLFQGEIDELKLEFTVPQELRELPQKSDLRIEDRITALIQSPKNTKTLFARSVGKGLLKSNDHGETWLPLNNGLSTRAEMAVRSVAVHPENSSIVLRSGGRVVNGNLISGLWRSEDAGNHWKLITDKIDFDGRGPTTLFGEVILFCPQDPNLVIAGGETKGLFLSRDAGQTWANMGLNGERITSMAFSPATDQRTKTPTLVVGTFDDSEFSTLGLGKPATPTEAPGRIYWCSIPANDTTVKLSKVCEIKDFGVTNMVFDTEKNFVNFATTRGIYYTWVHGAMYAKRKLGTPNDRLFTAINARPFDKWSKLTCAAPFSSSEQNPVYFTNQRSRNWTALSPTTEKINGNKGGRLNRGISCILPDIHDQEILFLCNNEGIFKTTDGGRSYRNVHLR
eukprot:COSAG01_NODE_97_length_26660_cov_100.642935_18_plen_1196_part_00